MKSVEAVAGEEGEGGLGGRAEELFRSLRTRWELRDEGKGTEAELWIEVQWKNMVYATMSQAAAPKVAGIMVEAFEKRAREVLG